MFIQLFHSSTRKTSIYLGHFSSIKINILVVGYDSYMDFIQSMGLVLSIKINFLHDIGCLGSCSIHHDIFCLSINMMVFTTSCMQNEHNWNETIESILCFWNMYQTNKFHKDMLIVMTKGPWPHQTSRNSQNSNNGLKAT